jgi:hypothetical protein
MSENMPESEQETTTEAPPILLSPDFPFAAAEIKRYAMTPRGLPRPLPSEFGLWSYLAGSLLGPRMSNAVASSTATSENEKFKKALEARQNALERPPSQPRRGGGLGRKNKG